MFDIAAHDPRLKATLASPAIEGVISPPAISAALHPAQTCSTSPNSPAISQTGAMPGTSHHHQQPGQRVRVGEIERDCARKCCGKAVHALAGRMSALRFARKIFAESS